MKNKTLYLTSFVLFLASCVGGGAALDGVDSALRAADRAQERALAAADSAAAALVDDGDAAGLYRGHLDVAGMYASLDLEKSLGHIRAALDLALKDPGCGPDAATEARLRLASLYNSQGEMVKDAAAIFDSLDPAGMSEEVRRQYYILGVQINRSLADTAFDRALRNRYRRAAADYRDSVMASGAGTSAIIAANRLAEDGRLAEARGLLEAELPPEPGADKGHAPVYHTIAGICLRQGMREDAVRYLALAAESDLRGGVREYKALPELAVELLAQGDIPRAYSYIHRSARDAVACHASARQLEIAASIPAIDAAFERYQDRRTLTAALVCLCALLAGAGVGLRLVTVRRKNRELRAGAKAIAEARDSLQAANESMRELNMRLEAESRVKEQYITAFMDLCLSYLRKMESYRAELGKIAAKGDWATLTQTIKSSRYVNREVDQFFRQFDKAFLSLYPGFIASLNSLLREDERFEDEAPFSTELRIYALVRLGVGSGAEIAKFLRCSESTVYNYRTQMRNRAKDRSTFEDDFAALRL